MKIDINSLDETQKIKLVNNRWDSSSTVWDIVNSVYKSNVAIYSNKAEWLSGIPQKRKSSTVQANRIFVNMEAVINSLIANPPGLNILPSRDGEEAQDFARKLESFFQKKYQDLNTKEVLRMGLRNLYFGRLVVIKAFWNPSLGDGGDFDFRAIDPRKVRFGKYARKESDSEFAIEDVEDNLCAVIERFPEKKNELMKKYGITDENHLYIKNPDVTYKEAWIQDHVIFKLENIILGCIKNPYWDWDGILVTEDEEKELGEMETEQRRDKLQAIKLEQDQRKTEMAESQATIPTPVDGEDMYEEEPVEVEVKYKPYFFNYFDAPRKPYIFATVFNN